MSSARYSSKMAAASMRSPSAAAPSPAASPSRMAVVTLSRVVSLMPLMRVPAPAMSLWNTRLEVRSPNSPALPAGFNDASTLAAVMSAIVAAYGLSTLASSSSHLLDHH